MIYSFAVVQKNSSKVNTFILKTSNLQRYPLTSRKIDMNNLKFYEDLPNCIINADNTLRFLLVVYNGGLGHNPTVSTAFS